MNIHEDNKQKIRGKSTSLSKDKITSNSKINSLFAARQKSFPNETNIPSIQHKYSYSTGRINLDNSLIKEEEEVDISQEMKEVKSYQKEGGKSSRYEQTITIKKEPTSTTKIENKVFQSVKPVTETSIYEKRVTTKTTTTRGGDATKSFTGGMRNNVVQSNGVKTQRGMTNTYTRPFPVPRGNTQKNTNLHSYMTGRIPSKNNAEYSKYNKSGANNSFSNNSYSNYSSLNTRKNQNIPTHRRMLSSQSFIENKYLPKRPENLAYKRNTRSPNQNEIKRKTINRGNVQITHIINSTKPSDFHITENLKTEPKEMPKVDKTKLKNTGKSSWTSSCQDNIKPIIRNLKGKTTVFQHAQGIGMTNDMKENINPQFYCSEIKKLDPIIKEKEKEKVEYMTFRNNGCDNLYKVGCQTSRTNYNSNSNSVYNYKSGTNNILQKRSFANNNYNTYTSNVRGIKPNSLKINGSFNMKTFVGNRNNKEINKGNRTQIPLVNRNQYRTAGNPIKYSTTTKRVYNSNSFIK
jgi:hypothetical protein